MNSDSRLTIDNLFVGFRPEAPNRHSPDSGACYRVSLKGQEAYRRA